MANILVIKLSALGDFVQALGPMSAIRKHHSGDKITLLTTTPYADFAEASGYFDEIIIDQRAKWWQIGTTMQLKHNFLFGDFARVYDLQTSKRSSRYYGYFAQQRRPEWSGIVKGCSHPHANPKRNDMHTIERQAEQLAMAGIDDVPLADLSWAESKLKGFKLPKVFALLVPGGAPSRPKKRWSKENYAALAVALRKKNITPVILGTSAEQAEADAITAACPKAVSLIGETDFLDIATLARTAICAVGNDTGPMHLIALAGCQSTVLYSAESDPALCAQRGPKVSILRKDALADVSVEEVMQTLV